MSLETILEKNTAALEKHSTIMEQLLARLAAGVPAALAPAVEAAVAAAPKPAAAPEAASGPATAAGPAADAPTTTGAASSPAAESAAVEPQPSTAATTSPVTYANVKPLILKINTDKGRNAAMAALKKFGVTTGPDLKPEQYADFVAHANTVLAS